MEDLKAILLEARTLTGAARAAYLDRVCDGNPSLREEIDSLLEFESAVPSVMDDGGLLQRLNKRSAASASETSATLDLDVNAAFEAAAAAANSPVPSEPIGPYRLVEVIGEGGMGVVYRAEQTHPIRREVALKLIRRGLDTDRIVARFDSERQALARMDHAAIARVLDAGASADGRPYFVMELVQGAPITEYCDREKLTLHDRIKLAIAVCHAVQHAHQKGIIHRDLKPSNILVASQDGMHMPKVIDFGIAKAIEEPLTDYTLLTRVGQFIGTPDYMSPEQAGVLDVDVDTRTDVYALGVLLYELLSGRRPHQFERRTQDEVQAVLRDQTPERPSTCLSTRRRLSRPARPTTALDAETLARIAASRRTTSERLRRQLAGDLDNIVLKAMQKEPARRYGSIEQFADDLQRYLDGKPVLARPDTWTYRTGKFVRRHAVGVGVAAAAVIMLVTFAVVMAVQSARIARERDRALAAEQRARTEAETAQQVSTFLSGLFRSSDPNNSRGEMLTAREILDRGAKRIGDDLGDKPAVQGRLLQTLGSVYKQLGMYDEAATLMTQAIIAREKADPELLEESLNELGDIERYRGRLVDAEPILNRALELRRKKFGNAHTKVAQTLNNLALVYDEQGKFEDSERTHREALRIRRGLGPKDPGISNSLSNLGITLRHAGKYEEAATVLREALALRREANGNDHPLVANTLNVLGLTLDELGQYAEAETVLRESLAIRRKVLPPTHPSLADAVSALAGALQEQLRLDQAEQLYLESLNIYAALAAAPGARQSADMNLTVAQNNLASLYEERGDWARAEKWYQEALRKRRAIRGERHPSVATVLNNLARMRLTQGQFAAAERLSREALSIRLDVLDSEHMHTAATRTVLGQILHARGALDAADEQFRAALVFQGPKPPAEHPAIIQLNIARGRLLIDRRRAAEAEPLLRMALTARARRFAASDWRVAEAQTALARALLAQGKSDAAAPLLASSTSTLKQASPGQQVLRREADAAIAQLQANPSATPANTPPPATPLRASR
jgi:serine/threonine protein kinase/tetratricopeptide (TPR) repeat protein